MADFDLKGFIDELQKDSDLSPEEREQLETLIQKNAKLTQALRDKVLKRAEFSRYMDQTRDELKAEKKKVEDYLASVSKWKTDEEAKVQVLLDELETSKVQLADYEKRAAEEGLDLPKPEPRPDKKKEEVKMDTSGFITKDEAVNYAILPSVLLSLSHRHQKLFGTPLDDTAIVVEALQSGKTLEQHWKEKYKVGEREQEIAKTEMESEITRRVDEQLKAKISEMGLPSTRPGISVHPVAAKFQGDQTVRARSPIVPSGVDEAIAAFEGGKYRPTG